MPHVTHQVNLKTLNWFTETSPLTWMSPNTAIKVLKWLSSVSICTFSWINDKPSSDSTNLQEMLCVAQSYMISNIHPTQKDQDVTILMNISYFTSALIKPRNVGPWKLFPSVHDVWMCFSDLRLYSILLSSPKAVCCLCPVRVWFPELFFRISFCAPPQGGDEGSLCPCCCLPCSQ